MATNEELVFVSANKHKLQHAEELLHNLDIDITCLEFQLHEFATDDLFLITAGKATEAYDRIQKPCIVLNTGFYIRNYPGEKDFPGALIHRNLLIPLGVDGLLRKMDGITDRECYFKECLVYYDGDNLMSFYGIRRGNLLQEKRGTSTAEAWSELWSVFKPKNSEKTLAEMTKEERSSKQDGHTDALEEFANWYSKHRVVDKVMKR